jgi:hypothetical protein
VAGATQPTLEVMPVEQVTLLQGTPQMPLPQLV